MDPWANEADAMHEYGVKLTPMTEVHDADCVIVAVAHDEFKAMTLYDIKELYRAGVSDEEKVLIDVKGLYNIADLKKSGLQWWRL